MSTERTYTFTETQLTSLLTGSLAQQIVQLMDMENGPPESFIKNHLQDSMTNPKDTGFYISALFSHLINPPHHNRPDLMEKLIPLLPPPRDQLQSCLLADSYIAFSIRSGDVGLFNRFHARYKHTSRHMSWFIKEAYRSTPAMLTHVFLTYQQAMTEAEVIDLLKTGDPDSPQMREKLEELALARGDSLDALQAVAPPQSAPRRKKASSRA